MHRDWTFAFFIASLALLTLIGVILDSACHRQNRAPFGRLGLLH
jgi:hypothetical protein